MAEQLICNQQVDGSTPFTSSTYGRVPERPMGADCKSVAFASMVRIHLLPPVKNLKRTTCVRIRFFSFTFSFAIVPYNIVKLPLLDAYSVKYGLPSVGVRAETLLINYPVKQITVFSKEPRLNVPKGFCLPLTNSLPYAFLTSSSVSKIIAVRCPSTPQYSAPDCYDSISYFALIA